MDTVFKTHLVDIDYIWGKEIYLIPFGDVHRDTPSCDVDRWNWFREGCKKYPKDRTYYLGMGDFNDFASSKEQKALLHADIHDQTRDKFDEIVKADNRKFAEEIKFMRGHLLGLLDGNHNWVFHDGKTATEDLCERVDAPYLGWLSHLTIDLHLHNSNGTTRAKGKFGGRLRIHIIPCHGKAGGKLMGTSINQVDDLTRIFPVADIYIMGHDHQRLAVPKSILVPSNRGGDIKQKRQFLARSGSFKKGYCPGVSGYEVGRLLRPATSELSFLRFPSTVINGKPTGWFSTSKPLFNFRAVIQALFIRNIPISVAWLLIL